MKPALVDASDIKRIVDKTVKMIESSKNEIFSIVEGARDEVERIRDELKLISSKIQTVIQETDYLEAMDKAARQKLVTVSKDFNKYAERDIKEAYEKASEIRLKHSMKQMEEKNMREQRTQLEMQLRKAQAVLEAAERLINQVGVAMQYLSGGITEIQPESSEDNIYWGIKVLEAQEEERKRISRDIHDGPAQSMANIVLKAEICKTLMKRNVEMGLNEMEGLKDTVRNTLQDIRKIIYDLRPMSLDDLGLVPTLRRFLTEFSEETGIQAEIQTTNKADDVEKIIQLALFRLVQEVTNNIRKHSRAKRVDVELNFGSKYLQMDIKDDGIGFDLEETLQRCREEGNHYGLLGQIERVHQLHGEIKIDSTPGQGTHTLIRLPVSREVMRDDYHANTDTHSG